MQTNLFLHIFHDVIVVLLDHALSGVHLDEVLFQLRLVTEAHQTVGADESLTLRHPCPLWNTPPVTTNTHTYIQTAM